LQRRQRGPQRTAQVLFQKRVVKRSEGRLGSIMSEANKWLHGRYSLHSFCSLWS
jgi:hypothetical protein